MKKIKNDIDNVLTLLDKEKLLKEINQEDLLNLFKSNYKNNYKPLEKKKVSLDQQLSIAITAEEKDYLKKELTEISKKGASISVSSYIRNKTISEIDIVDWNDRAIQGLKLLMSDTYDVKKLKKNKALYLKMLDTLASDDKESHFYYNKKLKDVNSKLEELFKQQSRRGFRLSGRVTFNEANTIRWRAARLTLTVADYMRFMLFGYLPFSDGDKHLTIDARKRFYISIMDVAKNGWGNPPQINECSYCARYKDDIRKLQEKIAKYEVLLKKM